MFVASAYLTLVAAPSEAVATQARLDGLISACAARRVVSLTAQTSTEVVIEIRDVRRAPTARERRRLECVLNGMKRMPDLQFGFIGNDVE